MRRKPLLVLLSCLVVATIGFGITLPILPFYAERLALRGNASGRDVAMQVGLLTAVYPMLQLVFAPLWGWWSDRFGRKRLVLLGIAGTGLAQVAFGFATTLPRLYAARVFGGILSSAIFPAAAAYVADSTTERARARGMAWLGTATSLGVVVGPALGAGLSRAAPIRSSSGFVVFTSFAIPFLVAAALAFIASIAAFALLPESVPIKDRGPAARPLSGTTNNSGVFRSANMRALLGMALAGQFALALFESTFALYSKRMWGYGPTEVGAAFIVCGLVMAVAQAGVAAIFAKHIGELPLIAAGFALVGVSLGFMPGSRSLSAMLASVAVLALGVAFISPNVAALISVHSDNQTGTALGIQGAANSVGQAAGTVAGGAMLGWQMEAPFRLSAGVLLVIAMLVGWRSRANRGVAG